MYEQENEVYKFTLGWGTRMKIKGYDFMVEDYSVLRLKYSVITLLLILTLYLSWVIWRVILKSWMNMQYHAIFAIFVDAFIGISFYLINFSFCQIQSNMVLCDKKCRQKGSFLWIIIVLMIVKIITLTQGIIIQRRGQRIKPSFRTMESRLISLSHNAYS